MSITPPAQETIHNEWHRSPENADILKMILNKVFQPDCTLIAHHVCYQKDNMDVEIASVETLLFDHNVLQMLFGSDWKTAGFELMKCNPAHRLLWVRENCPALFTPCPADMQVAA